MGLHLIEKMRLYEEVEPGVYDSGFWAMDLPTAVDWIGEKIYLHRRQAERSYLGGRIADARMSDSGTYPGRIVFRFEEEAECTGVTFDGVWNQWWAED